jgi:hypothetical protein
MQLPNFLKDPDLNALREQMGATELGSFRLAFNVYRFTISDLEQSLAGGIVIDDLSKVRTLDDKTLSYKDRRVLLHLRDVHALPTEFRGLPAPRPAFHVGNCAEVRRLRGLEVAPEVVLVTREDGEFKIRLIDGGSVTESHERLAVCGECLHDLGLPAADVVPFDIVGFFQAHARNVSDTEPSSRSETGRLRALRD